jgi:Ankyrin repeats (many copies)
MYSTLYRQQLTLFEEYSHRSVSIPCVPEMTLCSSVLTSPSRVIHAHESGLDGTSQAYQRAAGKHADSATLVAAHELGMQYTATIMAGTAQCNKLAEVQYLRNQGCSWPKRLLAKAASSGFFELVHWCHEQGCAWNTIDKAPRWAARSGNIELMAWVLQQPGAELSAEVMCAAASRGRLAMCHYLFELQCPWTPNAAHSAASGGHIDLLRWLIDSGCPWNDVGCADQQRRIESSKAC